MLHQLWIVSPLLSIYLQLHCGSDTLLVQPHSNLNTIMFVLGTPRDVPRLVMLVDVGRELDSLQELH